MTTTIVIKPPKAPLALSHSRLSDYIKCPRQFYLKYVSKDWPTEDDSPHLIRGSNVHKQLEKYIIQKTMDINVQITVSSLPEVETTKPFVDSIISNFEVVHPEIQLAVDKDFNQVEWFSKQAYYRAILDMLALNPTIAFIGDFKTGKLNDYSEWGGQLHLAATMVLSVFKQLEQTRVAYIYVDHKKVIPKDPPLVITREDLPALHKHYHDAYDMVNADASFLPKVNDFCKWCKATKSQCEYSRKL